MSTQPERKSTKSPIPHTPGPWYVERKYDGGATVAIIRDWVSRDNCGIAVHGPELWIHGINAVEMIEANAHLIAAAPEMLDALQHARAFIDTERCACGDCDALIAHVDAAIAKAEGK